LGVFEFILLIVLISTIGKVLEARGDRMSKTSLPPAPNVQHLEDMVGEMNSRLARLEEERDFYRALLEPPETPQRVPDGAGEAGGHPDIERS
jgi:hypothetical protein